MEILKFFGEYILNYPLIVLAILVLMNLVALIAYVSDKRKAKKGKWRTPEATLIALAWLFGSVGALIGMYGFHHKTQHVKFILLVPLAFVVQSSFLIFSVYFATI